MSLTEERAHLALQKLSLGQRIRWYRTRRHLSQEALAEAIEASTRSISRWEHDLAIPQPVYRERLCHLLGIDPTLLLGGASEAEEETSGRSDQVPIWHVPFRRNPFFTGRETILARLHAALQSSSAVALTQAISGLGGIGKTQTALEYAYRFREHYQAILWVPAETRALFLASFAALAQPLGLPEQHEADQQRALAAIRRWLHTHPDWLLILDNLEDWDLLSECIPTGPGRTLLTTRAQATGILANGIELAPLSPLEGVHFLLRRAKLITSETPLEHVPQAERTWAEAITTLLGGLPLALDQAGAYMEETGCGLEGYLARCQTHLHDLLQRRGRVTSDHPDSVIATLTLACARVEQANPAAADILRVCAFLHPEAIPEELFTTGAPALGAVLATAAANPVTLDAAMGDLRRFSLIQRHPQTRSLSLHRLVQAVIKETLTREEQRLWAERAVRAINRILPEVANATWFGFQPFLPQALAGASLITCWQLQGGEAARLLDQAGAYLRERGQYAEAEQLLKKGWLLRKHAARPEPLELARSLHNLAGLYLARGQYWRCAPLYQGARAIQEHALGPEHPDVAQTLSNLATLYRHQGRYAQAESLLQRAIAIQEPALGPDHPDVAQSLNELALLYWTLGEYRRAEPLYQRALCINERTLGPEHPHTALTLNNLALIYQALGQDGQAEALWHRARQLLEQTLGPDHPEVATILNCLATLYQSQGKHAEAEPLHRRALAIREEALGAEHPLVANSLNNLAKVYRNLGRYAEAEAHYQRSLAIRERVLGPEHPATATGLSNLAQVYQDQGRYAEAEPLHQRALRIHEHALGPEHPRVAATLEKYAALLRQTHREDEAAALEARAQAIRARIAQRPPSAGNA